MKAVHEPGVSNLHWGPMVSLSERATPLMQNCIWSYLFVIAQLSNVGFRSILTSCQMQSSILFTTHLFLTRDAL